MLLFPSPYSRRMRACSRKTLTELSSATSLARQCLTRQRVIERPETTDPMSPCEKGDTVQT